MIELKTTIFQQDVTLTFSGTTIDDRSELTVAPDYMQEMIEELCADQPDGRGVPMGNGVYTAMGVNAVLVDCGCEVSGLADYDVPEDEDGAGSSDAENNVMLESAPAHVQEHHLLLGRMNS